MKDSNPPRLGEARGEEQFLRDVLRIAKEETMTAPRVAGTLARFEATKLQGAGPAGAEAKTTSFWRSTLPIRLGASLAILCAIGVGLHVRDEGTSAPVPSNGTVAPFAERAPTAAPSADTTATTRVEDLPAAPPPVHGSTTDVRAGTIRTPSAAPSGPPSATGPAAPAATASAAASSFHEQLALLEAARSALAQGDSEGCLRALDRYEERFRAALFSDEIAAMRIEALAARGDRARARALGEAFLARSPNSAYASRIRSLLTTTP